jgi:hypothetical protein
LRPRSRSIIISSTTTSTNNIAPKNAGRKLCYIPLRLPSSSPASACSACRLWPAKRTKEIGIRKVLGASALSLVRLLTREFVILVALANLVAWPIAYVAMNRWLQDFAYRISLSWQTFALAGCAVLFLALLTVSAQAIKAALANPVDSLRYE